MLDRKESPLHRILITGGAGFIGSFLVDKLLREGHQVRILDNLEDQVHGGKIPDYLNPGAEFIKGDVRDYQVLGKALEGIDVVFHLASRVGVAQSNYQIKDYTDTNVGGTANLLDLVVKKKLPIKKIIMTASMTSYGEGECHCKSCGRVKPVLRSASQMKKRQWELFCPYCSSELVPVATLEESPLNNNSIYASTKNMQETMLLLVGKLYHIPVVSLRCFNVYGPRQSLSNPYTGVTAIFISRLKNNKRPVIYEDGNQSRDFVSVHDVVAALIASMNSAKANYQSINIGSGKPTSIRQIAVLLAKLMKKPIEPQITGEFRVNDIRHCYADITKAKKLLSWRPKIALQQGLNELIDWSQQEKAFDLFNKAQKELRDKSLL